MIEIKHLTKTYKNAAPLKDVNVTIHDGDVISIIGPSGTGKSTLLRCLNLIEKPTSGELWIDGKKIDMQSGKDLAALHRKIGMVFQECNLFANLSVIENIMIPQIEILGRSKQEAYDNAILLLKDVGLVDKKHQYPDTLSGGQKQRVAIARALSMDADVILFDEPTSALDPTMVNEVLIVISQLAKRGKTMLIVTHEMKFARKISNRVFYMDEGGIYEDGSPEQIFEHPKRDKTARFIKQAHVLDLLITTKTYDYPKIISEIDQYGYKYNIRTDKCNRIAAVFEELCNNILIAELKARGFAIDIKVGIEFFPEMDEVKMRVQYSGHFDPGSSEDKLAYTLLKHQAESVVYRDISSFSDSYSDEVTLVIK